MTWRMAGVTCTLFKTFLWFSLCCGPLVWLGGTQAYIRQKPTLADRHKKKSAELPGTLMIGGLHMIHERGEGDHMCGKLMPQGGLQAAEVMLYTIDRANQMVLGDRNLSMGCIILDDCDRDTYGLQQASTFIQGSVPGSNIDDGDWQCADGSTPNLKKRQVVVSGVVGAASSVTSVQVANLLRLFKIPQISFFSTSPELSNKERFEYFSRTIPSDLYQTRAMADLVEGFNWSYISVVYEESTYGIKAFEKLEELLKERGICLAVTAKLPKDSEVAKHDVYDEIVEKLVEKNKAKGVIVYGSDQEVEQLMKAVKKNKAGGMFTWIGSDGWAARSLVTSGQEKEVEGTLSLMPQAAEVEGFRDYFLKLTVENNHRNPWFAEFWEDQFSCRYPGAPDTPFNQKYKDDHTGKDIYCTGQEELTANNTVFESQLQFVSDAVMAFAYAFRDMHTSECGPSHKGLCNKMELIDGEKLLRFLRKVNFTGLAGDEFTFDEAGDGPARYNIIHYKRTSSSPVKYDWVTVGTYNLNNDPPLKLNTQEINFLSVSPGSLELVRSSVVPPSECSQECPVGEAKVFLPGERCCWECQKCGQYQFMDNDTADTVCSDCPMGELPDSTHSRCVEIPLVYLSPRSSAAIVALSFSVLGVLLTVAIMIIYIKYNDTPVVRASGRELSYVLLVGLLLCYSVTFLLVLRPTNVVCGLQRFLIGVSFAIVYAALLTKTNRIARIFRSGQRSAKKLEFISPLSQLVICSALVMVQVIINLAWLVMSPPSSIRHFPTREDHLLVCQASINASYLITFSYPILLVIICTVYAVLTRKIPEAFNESKFIGFSMYTTCVIWLAFIPIFIATANHTDTRITSMSFAISLSATVTLACLFIPKIYIIIFHPEKNIRSGVSSHTMAKYTADVNNGSIKKNNTKLTTNGGETIQIGNLGGSLRRRGVTISTQTVENSEMLQQLQQQQPLLCRRSHADTQEQQQQPLLSSHTSTQTLNSDANEAHIALAQEIHDVQL